jgi:hypothetical protein
MNLLQKTKVLCFILLAVWTIGIFQTEKKNVFLNVSTFMWDYLGICTSLRSISDSCIHGHCDHGWWNLCEEIDIRTTTARPVQLTADCSGWIVSYYCCSFSSGDCNNDDEVAEVENWAHFSLLLDGVAACQLM